MKKLILTAALVLGLTATSALVASADGGVHHPDCVTVYKDLTHLEDTPVGGTVYVKVGNSHYSAGYHEAGWDVPATWTVDGKYKDVSHYDVCGDPPPTTTQPPVTTTVPETTTTTEAPPSTTTEPPTTTEPTSTTSEPDEPQPPTVPPSTSATTPTTAPETTTAAPSTTSTVATPSTVPQPPSAPPRVDVVGPPPVPPELPQTGTQHVPGFLLLGAGLAVIGLVARKLARE